jgi:hypothetical protein
MGISMDRILGDVTHFGRNNSPAIWAGLAIAGTMTTAYLTARATVKACRELHETYDVFEERYIRGDDRVEPKDAVKAVWKFYIPPAVSGVLTIVCMVTSVRVGNRRTASITAAAAVAEKAFDEYRNKIVEKFGETKEQRIRDELAEEKILRNPPKDIIVTGSGEVLCCELFTGRYFKSSMEKLRKAENDINAQILAERYITLNEFYYAVELPITSTSNDVGWDSDRLLELQFTAVLNPDGNPCLAFDYNYIKPV